jgi:hypothetical protein
MAVGRPTPRRTRLSAHKHQRLKLRISVDIASPLTQAETSAVIPETRYAKTVDGVHIAYQVVGSGAVDIVAAIGWTTNIGRCGRSRA